MDRSFLSSENVIAQSRKFVCIRTATYEDAEEANFIKQTIFGGANDLRNFGFCILAPDGKETIRVSERGPNFVYENASALAKDLKSISSAYTNSISASDDPPGIPKMKSVRLALNVASCDGLPCAIVYSSTQESLELLIQKCSKAVWQDDLMGKYVIAASSKESDLKSILGNVDPKPGIYIAQPNEFGAEGKVLRFLGTDSTSNEIQDLLFELASSYVRNGKSHNEHVRKGRRTNQLWETEVPVPKRRRRR